MRVKKYRKKKKTKRNKKKIKNILSIDKISIAMKSLSIKL